MIHPHTFLVMKSQSGTFSVLDNFSNLGNCTKNLKYQLHDTLASLNLKLQLSRWYLSHTKYICHNPSIDDIKDRMDLDTHSHSKRLTFLTWLNEKFLKPSKYVSCNSNLIRNFKSPWQPQESLYNGQGGSWHFFSCSKWLKF